MKRLGLILAAFAASLLFSTASFAAEKEEIDMKAYIFGHIADSYEWHITTINGKSISIPLPCIVYSDGSLKVFSFKKL